METWKSNNSKYVGHFEKSKKNGHGRYEWADGSFYEGNFKDGVFDGEGTYYFADLKKTYTGGFRNANMEGFGKEVWQDGKVYVGHFKKGRKHGEGTMTYPNKKQYRGNWEKNLKHGTGYETNLKVSTQRMGEWRRGKWVRWLSATQKVAEAENTEQTEQTPLGSMTERPRVRHQSQLSATNISRNRPQIGGQSASVHAKSSIFKSEPKFQ